MCTNRKTKVKIIAVGNDLYGDDGIGKAVLTSLTEIPEMQDTVTFDGATDALGLIDQFADVEHAIIIDAAQMGEIPGTVRVFGRKDIKLIKMDHLSVHGISLADTFNIAELIDALPKIITIIGIEPENISISEGLSDVVSQSIPEVISQIINLKKLNFDSNRGSYA